MGTVVLNSGTVPSPNVYPYAHCLRDAPGGVTVLVVNADRQHVFEMAVPSAAQRYTLSANKLEDNTVQLNGNLLQLTSADELPQLIGLAALAGRINFAPASITFLAIPAANNPSCR
jgi:heparanase